MLPTCKQLFCSDRPSKIRAPSAPISQAAAVSARAPYRQTVKLLIAWEYHGSATEARGRRLYGAVRVLRYGTWRAVPYGMRLYGTVPYRTGWYGAVRVLRYATVRYGTVRYGARGQCTVPVPYGTVRCGACGAVTGGTVRCGTGWCGAAQCGGGL